MRSDPKPFKLTVNNSKGNSIVPPDSNDDMASNLTPETLSAVKDPKRSDVDIYHFKKMLTNEMNGVPLCLNCSYTVNEIMASPEGLKPVFDLLDQEKPSQMLQSDFNALKSKIEHLKAKNRTLKMENSKLNISLINLKKSFRILPPSMAKTTINQHFYSIDQVNTIINRLKAESDQRINFLYKKIEQYIINVGRLETTISELKYQYHFTLSKFKAENNTLRLNLSASQLINSSTRQGLDTLFSANRFSLRKSSCCNLTGYSNGLDFNDNKGSCKGSNPKYEHSFVCCIGIDDVDSLYF